MKKILILFLFIPFCLEAGRFPTAHVQPKVRASQVYLNRVLRRLDTNKTQKQSLVRDLHRAACDNDKQKIDDIFEALAVRCYLEQTMLLQAKIGCGEVEQEQKFFGKRSCY